MGKQIADFTLMQMFPWFGTRKAARSEASEMARMAYEQFRDTRNNLWYEVKAQWYQLSSLNEQYHITEANIRLLYQLEQLALNRFFRFIGTGSSLVDFCNVSCFDAVCTFFGKWHVRYGRNGQPGACGYSRCLCRQLFR